jgi:glutaryl-CoA dehydrogenase
MAGPLMSAVATSPRSDTNNSQTPFELFDVETLIGPEDAAIRDKVRRYTQDRIVPAVGDWFEAGELPTRELARELGDLGLLGMHLEGYGCAGTSALAYGLACLELEAGDSGIRSPCTPSGASGPTSRRPIGCPKWLPGTRSAASV